jgi:hypothetical protein
VILTINYANNLWRIFTRHEQLDVIFFLDAAKLGYIQVIVI